MEAAWATSSENLIVDGEYNFTDRLKADFARHAYKDEWFIGSKRAGHLAQLVYEDSYNVRDIDAVLNKGLPQVMLPIIKPNIRNATITVQCV